MSYNLTNQAIEDSFQPLLQIDSGSSLRDGSGSLVDNIIVTSSYALVAEVALNASASQNWNDITNKPSGLVSGSSQLTSSYDQRYVLSGSIQPLPTGVVSGSSQIDFGGITGVPSGLVSGSSQIDLAQTFGTASHAISASYAVSASYEIIKEVSSSYADNVPFDGILNKPTLVSSSAQVSDLTASLLETASNDFSQITFTKGDGSQFTLDTTPRIVWESVKNGNGQILPKGTPVYASGSVGNAQLVFPASASNDATMPAVYILAQELGVGEEGYGITHGFINGVNTSLFNAGDEVYVGSNGGFTNQRPTGSNLIQKLGTVVRSDANNGSGVIQIDSIVSVPNIQQGYTWVGDINGVAQPIPTSSFGGGVSGSFVTTGSFNTYTASNDSKVNSLIAETSSYAKLDEENTFTANSNTFTGGIYYGLLQGQNIIVNPTFRVLTPELVSWVNTNLTVIPGGAAYQRKFILSGSLDSNQTLTASLEEGYILVGNSSNRTSAIPTSSLVVNIDTGSLVSTSSFNEYTSSTDFRLSSIELETASLDTRVTSLENFSSSLDATYVTETELGVVTQSLQNSIDTKLDSSSFNSYTQSTDIRVTDLENFSSSLDATFATDAELASATQSLINSIDTKLNTGSFNSYTQSADIRITDLENFSSSLDATFATDTELNNATQSLINSIATKLDTGSYLTDSASFDGRIDSLEQFSSSLDTTYVTESELGVVTQSLQNQIDTKLDSSSFNSFTQSYINDSSSFDGRIDSLENFSSSLDANFVSETELGIYTSSNDSKVQSLIDATGSYATTGSNNFFGNQDVSGSVSSTTNQSNTHYNPQLITDNVNIPTGQNGVIIGNTTIAGDYTIEGNSEVYVFTPPVTQSIDTSNLAKLNQSNTFTGQTNTFVDVVATSGSFNDYLKVGNENELEVIATGFNKQVRVNAAGGLQVTSFIYNDGAIYQGTQELNPATDSTASLAGQGGDFFQVNLPEGGTTHIDINSYDQSRRFSIQLIQNSATASLVTFAPKFKFPNGTPYTASTDLGAVDIIDVRHFGANQDDLLYVITQTKDLK
jgi:hypothetical protein